MKYIILGLMAIPLLGGVIVSLAGSALVTGGTIFISTSLAGFILAKSKGRG